MARSQVDMDNNEASVAAKNYFKDSGIESALALGGGTGEHLKWFLSQNTLKNSLNVEISATACKSLVLMCRL